MKNFDQAKFNNDLVAQHWEEMGMTENLDVMTEIFMGIIKDSHLMSELPRYSSKRRPVSIMLKLKIIDLV